MSRATLCAALAAIALGACAKTGKVAVQRKATLADSADQVMYGVRTLLTDRGVLRAELLSDTAYVFDENTRFEMRGVHTTFYRTTGAKDAVLTSKEGTYRTNANNMQARRDVVVLSEDGRQLTTSELRFDQSANEIAGDSAFVLTEPGRRLEGVGFRSDPNMNSVRVLKGASGNVGNVNVQSMGAPQGAAAAAPAGARTAPVRTAPVPAAPAARPPAAQAVPGAPLPGSTTPVGQPATRPRPTP